jgi:hypothetical protein
MLKVLNFEVFSGRHTIVQDRFAWMSLFFLPIENITLGSSKERAGHVAELYCYKVRCLVLQRGQGQVQSNTGGEVAKSSYGNGAEDKWEKHAPGIKCIDLYM